ncbi:MAG: chromate transporter [Phycisphaerales bacterium]|nr:chromate transporter [Phycisphaerales bacterium]
MGAVHETFAAFLRLGLTSFGGPIAHLAYFHREFVARRRWMDAAEFADTVALCQFLPGPTSSQVGFAIGLRRAGIAGGLAAWTAFTLPSAVIMATAGWMLAAAPEVQDQGWLAGLRSFGAAVVAHAVLGMVRTLAPTVGRLALAAAVAGALLAAGRWMGAGGAAALLQPGAIALGALVFGGGHVVLPLLEQPFTSAGWMDREAVMSGYALVQAMPGPLFTLASYLGAEMAAPHGAPAAFAGALLLTLSIFLPGILLVVAAVPAWTRLRTVPRLRGALAGANCAVIGLLAAALAQDVVPAAAAVDGGLAWSVIWFVALLWQERLVDWKKRFPLVPAHAPILVTAASAALCGQLTLGR